jgi:hypothetical protein
VTLIKLILYINVPELKGNYYGLKPAYGLIEHVKVRAEGKLAPVLN